MSSLTPLHMREREGSTPEEPTFADSSTQYTSPHNSFRKDDNIPTQQGHSIGLHKSSDKAAQPPPYSKTSGANPDYATYTSTGTGLASYATLGQDGRITVTLDLKRPLPDLPRDYSRNVAEFAVDQTEEGWKDVPKLSIVIMIVGSRGDVQPYVALGKALARDGHRIRIATHETFREFVTSHGLEFFNIGGDPKELMSYMVKNPGLLPGILLNGDISKKRKMLAEMILGCYLSTVAPDTGPPVGSSAQSQLHPSQLGRSPAGKPFVADALISNPPAFAHIHIAEKLGIPLLLTFTMPWSPTTAFAHPLVNISRSSSNAENGLTNYLSYALAEILTWQGIGDLVNDFRKKVLGLSSLNLRSGPSIADRMKVPWTYCMGPLVKKPKDWKNHIDIVGFYFLDLATNYEPPADLAAFLSAGEPPLYIGFGSVVVDDPIQMTKNIFEATSRAGVRALVSAGWGGLGDVNVPPHIFILGNVPHDWLFANDRVCAVVHHGGAGTTAIGLAKGRPTVIVPFFGDQGFWGAMVEEAGAGPKPITPKEMTEDVDALTKALQFAISPEARSAAADMAKQIHQENGVQRGVESFYRHLPLLNMRCDLEPNMLAVWWSTEYCLKMSSLSAQVLSDAKLLDIRSLDLHRSKEYDTRKKVSDPVSGGASAIYWTITHYYASIAQIFYSPVKGIINTTVAIPRGVWNIVTSVQEGFANVPKLYGSNVREPGKITDFSSGVKEAGKGLFYGYYDGITGLVREPLEGAKKGGFMGAVAGAGRSFINVTMRPAAGIMGVVAHPVRGALRGMKSAQTRKTEHNQRAVRERDGVLAAQAVSQNKRDGIIRAFEAARSKGRTMERQKALAEQAAEAMKDDVAATEPVDVEAGKAEGGSPGSSSAALAGSERWDVPASLEEMSDETPSTVHANVSDDLAEEAFIREMELAKQLSASIDASSSRQSTQHDDDDDDDAFQKELEMAKQISLAEQRGYDRAMEQANRGRS